MGVWVSVRGGCEIESESELEIYNGTNLSMGLLVVPVDIQMFAALTSPFPLISSSITAIFQHVRGISSFTNTISPALTVCPFLPVVWWNSLSLVRYSFISPSALKLSAEVQVTVSLL